MLLLSFVWLGLMIAEFTRGLSPFLERLSNFIWILFVVDFIIKFSLAPEKTKYLKKNWLTALALLLPALRVFRVTRLYRTAAGLRGLRLAKILTSFNRGLKALGNTLSKRGFGYVLVLSLLVVFAGAAGIFAFEKDFGVIDSYGTAVWWVAMMLTTMGSDYFPKSAEGRVLCWLIAVFGFAIFGYVTATVASLFIGQDQKDKAENDEILSRLKNVEDLLRKVTPNTPH